MSEPDKRAAAAASSRPLEGVRAIVVEDNWSIASAIRDMLTGAGCNVTGMAGTEHAALELASTGRFDVAILDIQLGGGDVRAVAAVVRKLGKAIVYVSGFASLELLPPELRSYTRLSKPVEQEALVENVRASAAAVRP